MARAVSALELGPNEKAELQHRIRSSTATQRHSIRARIVLWRAEEMGTSGFDKLIYRHYTS